MPDILIISPDPETRRMLEIAFELADASVKSQVNKNFLNKGAARADAVVIDLIGEGHSRWPDYFSALKKAPALSNAKTAAILPRSPDNSKASKYLDGADLIIKRPFELFDVVDKVTELAKNTEPRTQKKNPPIKRKNTLL